MADLRIKVLVDQLITRHNFELIPGNALWVAPIKKNHGTLIIALGKDGQIYVVARTYLFGDKEITGFRVYYDLDWHPFASVNDNGYLIKDPKSADVKMCQLIEAIYLKSEHAMNRVVEYP
jgi:hypothetical protein